MAKISIAKGVAIAFLSAAWLPDKMAASAQRAFPKRVFSKSPDWLLQLARRVTRRFADPPPSRELERFIAVDIQFRLAVKTNNIKTVRLNRILGGRSLLAIQWKLPSIDSPEQLAEFLAVSNRELSWLANLDFKGPTTKRLHHYVYTWIRKRSSGYRLVESPKIKLKQAQRDILRDLLSRIPTHSAAHGFCKGRNVLSYVHPHVGKQFCLKMDLKDFFPSIRFGRVFGLFRAAGYSVEVSRYLAAVCTNGVDQETLDNANETLCSNARSVSNLYRPRHLPQGAATSPAIGNLIAFRLDARLTGLAIKAGAAYTRYADDLLFSGSKRLAQSAKRFESTVGAIALEEGFEIQFRKTRFMRFSQRQLATGVVINQRPNLSRREFDQLKAIIFNSVREGPESQNRFALNNFREHLRGRLEWARQVNPVKARKLQALFSQIQW